MKILLPCVIMIVLIIPSSLSGQEMLSLSDNLKIIEEELLKCKLSLVRVNDYVTSLKINLAEAKSLLNSSDQEVKNLKSVLKISNQEIENLQKLLSGAQETQRELNQKVNLLEGQLTDHLKSLENLENHIQQMEVGQIKEIGELAKSYERKGKVHKILIWSLAAVAAGAITITIMK